MFLHQVRRLKEREVINETTNMEEYLTMEEELTNDQDAVVNSIRDVHQRCLPQLCCSYLMIVLPCRPAGCCTNLEPIKVDCSCFIGTIFENL